MVTLVTKILSIAILIGFSTLSASCVTYNECLQYEKGTLEYKNCVDLVREYNRVEYIETKLKPQLSACDRASGMPIWAYSSMKTKRMVQRGNYDALSIMDAHDYKGCCTGSFRECFNQY